MTLNLAEFKKITDAEDYFQFFQLPYDAKVVNVNRLHILKQFAKNMNEIDTNFPDLNEVEKLDRYKEALIQAYQVFLTSSPLQTKLFKVFHDQPKGVVRLGDIKIS
ncbi:MAG: nitrogenase-stabilizing/protective protein NifW [Hydrococcus sp. RU_2_2]|jgi:nitrogenase-stabilizing/protective protein|nr:nitrogenase-stabilizing/protective protein NifW [Hydrococcus sp. RU_2_2]NJP21190.1 nitrogenase-stabilizing/protective protein NifW [Hydrococcus sp. CRU_1_1]